MPQNKQHTGNPYGLKSVLIVRFSAIGDVAMTVPAIYSACMAYPDICFVMVTRQSMTPIFLDRPENLEVVGVDLKDDYKGLSGMRRLFSELRSRYGIDAIVDLHDVLRTKALRLMGRMKMIRVAHIHKGRRSKRALTRRDDKVMVQLKSSIERYRDVFGSLGLGSEELFNGYFFDAPPSADVYADIATPPAQGEYRIGIAPFAKHRGKIYPEELMEQVVDKLSRINGMRIFLFGGGDYEREVLGRWARMYPGVTSLAEARHGFGVELALISTLDVVVSMDSANMHLASLVNTPVVSVWGATHPYCGFKGWHQNDDNMIQLPLSCRPCSVFGDKPCERGDYLCLAGIKPRVIIDKVLSLLDIPTQSIDDDA